VEKQYIFAGIIVLLICLPSAGATSANPSGSGFAPACRENWGPYVNKLVYNIIPDEDRQVLALQDDDIDLIGHPVSSSICDELANVDNIAVQTITSNSYLEFVFNCAEYPLNVTSFRRAFAYALDKERMAELWSDSQVLTASPLDACIVKSDPFSAEGKLGFSYINSQVDKATMLLDGAGFIDIDHDGYRESPDGSKLAITLEYYLLSRPILDTSAEAVEVFDSIGINATAVYNAAGFGWWDNGKSIVPHIDYDIAYMQYDVPDLDADWLGYEFWSGYAGSLQYNNANFRNDTFDSYRVALLNSVHYDEVLDAAIEMQRIIADECPVVVSHEILNAYAYRTDKFVNLTNELIYGPSGWCSLCQLRLKFALGGPYGGTFRIGISQDISTFNLLNSSKLRSGEPLDMMYDSLLRRYPDGQDRPLLAMNWTIETHADNEQIREGLTRMTLQLDPRAVWTDGSPCTAQDVAFSFNYYKELEGGWLYDALSNLTAAYVRNEDVVVEFTTESYWHLHEIGYLPIIPKHVFERVPVEAASDHSPDPPQNPMVTLGPFNVSDYVAGEFVELTYCPNYYHLDPIDIPLSLSAGMVIEYVFECEIRWSISGGCRSYTIYIDGHVESSVSRVVGLIDSISTGPISISPGYHIARLVVTDYFGVNQSDTVVLNVPDKVFLWTAGYIGSGLVIYAVFWTRSKLERRSQKSVVPVFATTLFLGTVSLVIAAIQIQTRFWSGREGRNIVYDAIGVQVFREFFVFYPIALIFLSLALLFFPLMVWIYTKFGREIKQTTNWFILLTGLLVPSAFIFGEPYLTYYPNSYHIGQTCMGVITSVYAFHIGYVGIRSNAALMPFIGLALGSLIAISFILYEQRIIEYKHFVVPIVLFLSLSVYLFGIDLLMLATMAGTLPEIYIPIPSYPLGVLILGQKVKRVRVSRTPTAIEQK
jgi:peptide/nickel transport system substrate-binding protein